MGMLQKLEIATGRGSVDDAEKGSWESRGQSRARDKRVSRRMRNLSPNALLLPGKHFRLSLKVLEAKKEKARPIRS